MRQYFFVWLVQLGVDFVSLEGRGLKVPKVPVGEILKWDSDTARVYLSYPEDYECRTGISRVLYVVISSTRCFLLNFAVSLFQVFGGVLTFKLLRRGSKAA